MNDLCLAPTTLNKLEEVVSLLLEKYSKEDLESTSFYNPEMGGCSGNCAGSCVGKCGGCGSGCDSGLKSPFW